MDYYKFIKEDLNLNFYEINVERLELIKENIIYKQLILNLNNKDMVIITIDDNENNEKEYEFNKEEFIDFINNHETKNNKYQNYHKKYRTNPLINYYLIIISEINPKIPIFIVKKRKTP